MKLLRLFEEETGMNFGKVFRYIAKLHTGELVVWRVLASTRAEADRKIEDYKAECINLPVEVDYSGYDDNLVLY